jgi:hypothetical protein
MKAQFSLDDRRPSRAFCLRAGVSSWSEQCRSSELSDLSTGLKDFTRDSYDPLLDEQDRALDRQSAIPAKRVTASLGAKSLAQSRNYWTADEWPLSRSPDNCPHGRRGWQAKWPAALSRPRAPSASYSTYTKPVILVPTDVWLLLSLLSAGFYSVVGSSSACQRTKMR